MTQTPCPRVIFFDGVCNLCNGLVRFVIRRDPSGHFHFAPLQSEEGREIQARAGLSPEDVDTLVLADGDRAWVRSAAVIRILRGLRWPWPLLAVAWLVPRPIRDAGYRWVARHRYRWFGRQDRCMVPDPALASRFLTGRGGSRPRRSR